MEDFFSKDILTLAAVVLCGQGVFLLFDHPGFSQVYFMFNTFSFAAVLAMLFLENCEYRFRYARQAVVGTALVLVFFSCRSNFTNYMDVYALAPHSFQNATLAQSSGQNDVSALEMTGLRWLRDNLPEDVVLATNKVLFGNPEQTGFSRTFITSEYSQRQVYLEGFSSTNLPDMEFVMNRLAQLRDYYSGIPKAADVLRENGVTHAVLFKSGKNPSILLEETVIYENDDIAVLDLGEGDKQEVPVLFRASMGEVV